MKLFRRFTAALVAAGLTITGAAAYAPQEREAADAASTVKISPDNKYEINDGVFEGWGTSLCWWANRVGYSDSLAQKSADAFFGDDGLRMNIARFNIGGGDDPTHHHITRTDSNMPGYTVYKDGKATFDWTADANQRNVLQRCIKAAGDDMIVEMFSNSPPYYMTYSGCSSGGNNPGKDNLRSDQFTAFAEYLAEVCYHYKTEWGVDVQSVTPTNEPYTNFWGAGSAKQEGCHFDIGSSETKIILELQKAMKARGMDDVIISASDETSIDTQIDAFKALSSDAKNAVGRIDTHTYGGSKRSELKELALSSGKNLWMSEVDGGSVRGTNNGEMGAALWLAERMVYDCNNLNCSAWILWQAIDNHISQVGMNGNKDKGMVNVNGGYWGLAVADHDNDKIIFTKKYYAFGQFSRYIRPGMAMLKADNKTLSAFDQKNGQLVIAVVNDSGSVSDYTYDLSSFSAVGTKAQTIRTSNSESWKDVGDTALNGTSLRVSLPANSVTTFIIDGVKGSAALENKIEITKDMLSGTSSWNDVESTGYANVFDGKTSTYFDGLGGGWVQADLGKVYDISAVGYCPRSGYEYRMGDGMIQFSDDGENWTTAYTVSGKPSFGMHYVTGFSGTNSARYVRYAVPEGAPKNDYNKDSVYCCNIAELEIYGVPSVKAGLTKIKPVKVTGTASWKDNADTASDKVFDGDISTYFDGLSKGWVQADLGDMYSIEAIGYCPRKGYEYRMTDGIFMVSEDGENWEDIYTVTGKPDYGMKYVKTEKAVTARYLRYAVPEGTPDNGYNQDDSYCCNIAEIEIYGKKAEGEKYDLNSDGEFSAADLVLFTKYLLGSAEFTKEQYLEADINGNGAADAFDLVLMRRFLAA